MDDADEGKNGGGSGPNGPVVEQRVARFETILERLEPKVTEILLTGAKQGDLQALRVELVELKGKVSMLPTWWMLLVALLANWIAGAGTVLTLSKALHQ